MSMDEFNDDFQVITCDFLDFHIFDCLKDFINSNYVFQVIKY